MTGQPDTALKPGKCALLIVDMQYYCAKAGRGLYKHIDPQNIPEENHYLFSRIDDVVVPHIKKLLEAFRSQKGKAEVIFTYIECLTKDCRDQSVLYKMHGAFVPKGSEDAKILKEIAPIEDEVMIPKSACGVFDCTNIEYVLRNLGVTQLVVAGLITNQCVEAAVLGAADKGFLATVVENASAAHSQNDHEQSVKKMRDLARICSHDKIIQELQQWD